MGAGPHGLGEDPYDLGDYGAYPTQSYISSEVRSPTFNYLVKKQKSSSERVYTLLGPHGFKVSEPGPVILDQDGNLVWTNTTFGKALDFRVQKYAGEDYLTFWTGDDHVRGHGSGHYWMLDSSYSVYKKFGPGNGLAGDLHEFSITEAGTALITIYQKYRMNLGGAVDGYIWDCLFQELDLRNDEIVFEWRASDHVPLSQSYRGMGFFEGTKAKPWDWFHMNSVDKDAKGHYIVSSRYLQSILYVSGRTGQVLWDLGGKTSNFTDQSHGRATNFAYQHHARWGANNTMTIFDNAVDYEHRWRTTASRGLHLVLDMDAMTVELLAEYTSPDCITSLSQGSVQQTSDGSFLLGYGDVAAWTEFASDGTVLENVHFGPASQFWTDNVQSYRVFKFPWNGQPATQPSLAVQGNAAYASWNGATEVKTWVLQHIECGSVSSWIYESLKSVEKKGFETVIEFDPASTMSCIRVTALNDREAIIGTSPTIDLREKQIVLGSQATPGYWKFLAYAILALALALLLKRTMRRPQLKRWRNG